MKPSLFITALVLQVVAQTFGGGWGAAGAGVLIGLAMRSGGAFRTGALSAALATALLLAVAAARGADIGHFAGMIGGNFGLPGWGILAVTLLLPALQSGGLAGAIGRLTATR
jgi:hypothetical protein